MFPPLTALRLAAFAAANLEIHFAGGNFAKRYDHVLVGGPVVYEGLCTLEKLLHPFRRQHHQQEAIIDLFQTILNGNSCHYMLL